MSSLILPAIPRSHMFMSINEPMTVEWQNFFRDLFTKVSSGGGGGGGFDLPTELTIALGKVTVSGTKSWRFHSIDTTGNVASDDLFFVDGGNPGEVLLLQAENSARTVICRDYANLKLQYDFHMNNVEDKLMLICISSGIWHEISRASNGG